MARHCQKQSLPWLLHNIGHDFPSLSLSRNVLVSPDYDVYLTHGCAARLELGAFGLHAAPDKKLAGDGRLDRRAGIDEPAR